jgi:hypothetical protein
MLVSEEPQRLGDRLAHFVAALGGAVDMMFAGGTRVRVTLMYVGPAGVTVHFKGQNCFVARSGARPSGGTQLSQPGVVELIAKTGQVITRFQLLYSSPAAGHSRFLVGDSPVAISLDDCPRIVAVDFGPCSDLYFIYAPHPRAEAEMVRTKRLRKMRKS